MVITHNFGFTHWNAAAGKSRMGWGRLASPPPRLPAVAIFQARYSV